MPLQKFDRSKASEIAVLSQLESNLDNLDSKATRVEVDKTGKPWAVSGGRFHLLSPNIDEALDTMGARDLVSDGFKREWDAAKALPEVDRVHAQQDVLYLYQEDATIIGSQWMQKKQEASALYGYSTPVPRLMAWQSPGATSKAISKLTGSGGKVNEANGAWTVYEQTVGREQAEKNLLEQIIKDNPNTTAANRATRLLKEKVSIAGKGDKTLFQVLQEDNLDPSVLPEDIQALFQDSPQLSQLAPNVEVTKALAQYNAEENQFMQLERDNGVPVDEPAFKISKFLDALFMEPGDRARSEMGRALARLGINASGIGPDDIPERISDEDLAKAILGDISEDVKPLAINRNEPVLPQIIEWLTSQAEVMAKWMAQDDIILLGNAADPTNWVGLGIGKKIFQWFASVKYNQSIQQANRTMAKANRQKHGIDIEGKHEALLNDIDRLGAKGDEALANRLRDSIAADPGMVDRMKLMMPNTTLNDLQLARMALEVQDRGMDIINFVRQVGPTAFTDPKLGAQLTTMIGDLYKIVAPREAAKTNIGRSMGSLAEPESLAVDQFAEQFMKVTGMFVDPIKAAHHIAMFKDPSSLLLHMKNVTKPGWGKMYNEILVNGLLSGPMTLLGLNPLSNGMAFAMQLGQKQIAGLFGKGGIPASEAAREMGYAIAAIPAAWRTFWKTATSSELNIKTLVHGRQQKIDITNYQAITGENFPNAPKWLKGVIDVFGNITRLPTRIMVSQDESFKAIFYQAELGAMAGRLARETVNWSNMTLAQRHARTKDILKDMVANPSRYQDAHKAARHTALSNTFTAPGGPTMEALVEFTGSHPFWKTVFPFVRTPINILKRIKHDSGLTGKTFTALRSADKATRDEALGRLTLSGGLLSSIALLSSNGYLVGGRGPTDPKVRRLAREQLGKEQGALAFDTDGDGSPDRYLLLNTRTHVGQLMNLMGNLVELRGYLTDENSHAYDNIVPHIMGAVADLLTEAPFLEAIGDFWELMHQADTNGWDGVKNHIGKTGGTYLMPFFVGARGQIRRALDPTKRDTHVDFDLGEGGAALKMIENMIDSIKNQTPGFSESLLPDHNMFGKVNEYPLGMGPGDMEGDATARLVNLFLPVWNTGKISKFVDKDELEISKWMFNNDVTVRQPPRVYKGIQLPNNLYQQWKVLAGTGNVIDPNTGDILEKGVLESMSATLKRVVDLDDTPPIYDERSGRVTTNKITTFQSQYSKQLDTALQLLLSSSDWKNIRERSLRNQLSAGESDIPLSSNPLQRNITGIPLR